MADFVIANKTISAGLTYEAKAGGPEKVFEAKEFVDHEEVSKVSLNYDGNFLEVDRAVVPVLIECLKFVYEKSEPKNK